MPRKGQRLKTRKPAWPKPRGLPARADALATHSLTRWMEAHFEWMVVGGYSADTVRARRIALRRFIRWCADRGIDNPCDITKPIIERYQRHLFHARKANGQPHSLKGQVLLIQHVRRWFRWLCAG